MNLTDTVPPASLAGVLPAPGRSGHLADRTVRVLVLEDSRHDFNYLQHLLSRGRACPYALTWAPTPAAALAEIGRGRFDVGLFDYTLDGSTGLDFFRDLRALPCDLPVVFLTGSDDPAVDQAALDAGAADFLCKSTVDTTRLERAIRYAVSHAQMLAALRQTQAQLQLFLRSVPCAACICDSAGAVLYQNDLFRQHFSVGLIGTLRQRGTAVSDPQPFSHGGRHWLVTSFPMVEGNGRALQGIAAIDVTARVETESALRRTSTLLNGVLQSLPVIVGRLDADGVVLEAEGRKLEAYGLAPASLVGQRLDRLYPQLQPAVAAALSGGAVNTALSARHGGREWHADFSLFSDRESGHGAVFFGCDATHRRLVERELLRVGDAERNRIGSDLHDGLGQYLTGISCLSAALRDKLSAQGRAEAVEAATISSLVQEAITQTRALARGLCPVQVETSGLETALEDLTFQVQRLHGVACSFHATGPIHLCETAVALHLYRIAQEAINNALKHARARHITVTLDFSQETRLLRIEDDGCGFDPAATDGASTGLRLMPYRAAMIGGTLVVTSQPNAGTRVECRFPHPS